MTTPKTLVPMDMHNCFRECSVGAELEDRNRLAAVHPKMRLLIEKLARKHPHWRFIATQMNGRYDYDTRSYHYTLFRVYDCDDQLGGLDLVYHYGMSTEQYEIDNHRVRGKRQRSGASRTKDLAKAIKLVGQHFYAPTIQERVSKARGALTSAVHDAAHKPTWWVDSLMRDIKPQLVDLLVSDEALRARVSAMIPSADTAGRLAVLPEQEQLRRDTQAMIAARTLSTSTEALVLGDKVYLLNREDPDDDDSASRVPHSFAELPAHVAMAIGMLKLVEVKGFIPGVGLRADENVFFIMPEAKEEESA